MAILKQTPTPDEKKALASFGASLLKTFHAEYERSSKSRSMEYHRGTVIGWRWMLDALYGQRITEEIVEAAAEEANLTIPPACDIDDEGNWIGFDSGAHTYIGKLHE
ncbi:MAG: hypothetical protein P4L87_12700 [Formivibrio sp.]|jgi:hypothetical protein|nr:hypothetical protein [Formivibrio sp.]